MSSEVRVLFFAFSRMSNKFNSFKAPMVKLLSSPLSNKSRSGIESGIFSDTYTTASVTRSL